MHYTLSENLPWFTYVLFIYAYVRLLRQMIQN